jgi:glycosyltransferase involved in cell wall biosynthesis
VVFFLRNLAYRHGRTFEEVDAVLTPSRFLSAHYRSLFGVDSTPLPTPIALDETLAPHAEPVFATIINPAPEKGLAFFLDLADLARTRRPDIRFLAVEGRATIPEAARAGITLARNVVEPWRVYAVTRVLLAPSAGPDAGPRVIAEAHVNGIPTIGSDRGGVPEVTGRGGFILPLSDPAAWLDLLCRLHDDPAFLQSARRNASEAGGGHRDGTVDRAYIDYFERIAAG